LLLLAEQVARNYIFSQLPAKEIKNLSVMIDFDFENELNIDCTIDIQLIKHSKLKPQKIIDKAIEKIFETIEKELSLNP